MAFTAADVLSRARNQLIDTDAVQRWSDAELLQYLSDGLRTVSAADPSTASKVAVMKMVAGTRQSLPADGNSLLSVTRNMGLDGVTPGRAVRIIRREIMDDMQPTWHADAKVTTVYNYIYDPQDARAFSVYPPSNGSGYIEINYQYTPVEITATTATLQLPDAYLTPLSDYVLMRAHQKDGDFAAGREKSAMYAGMFKLFMDLSDKGEVENNPNLQTIPFNPSLKATAK